MARKDKGGKNLKKPKPDKTLERMFFRRMYGRDEKPAGEQTQAEQDTTRKNREEEPADDRER